MTTDKDQTIWKWKNTAHITKMGIEGTVALASLAGAITTILIATKVIAGPASLALIASPAGIAVLFIAAIYFAAAAYVSYKQMHAMKGVNGKDADFSVLLDDAIKSEIVEEEVNSDKQLSLKLSKSDYDALTQGKNVDDEIALNVLLKSKVVEVKFKHIGAANDNGNYKVVLTSSTSKEELGMTDTPLKVVVSNKDMNALKADVTTNLVNAVVDAIQKDKAVA